LLWLISQAIPDGPQELLSRTNIPDIFCALGDARSPRTIFFEQLVSQLITWKAIDNDIALLGDFNENVYTGRLACRLTQDDLIFTKFCRHHTGIPIPSTFWNASAPIDRILAGIKNVNTFILPALVASAIIDAS
jgi:hypothetical protein